MPLFWECDPLTQLKSKIIWSRMVLSTFMYLKHPPLSSCMSNNLIKRWGDEADHMLKAAIIWFVKVKNNV